MNRFLSRKLWVTLATLAASTWSAAAGLPWWAVLAQALAGVAYVVAEGLIDARAVVLGEVLDVAEDLIENLRAGLERAEQLDPGPSDVGALEPPRMGAAAAINPGIVIAIINLASAIVSAFRRKRRK